VTDEDEPGLRQPTERERLFAERLAVFCQRAGEAGREYIEPDEARVAVRRTLPDAFLPLPSRREMRAARDLVGLIPRTVRYADEGRHVRVRWFLPPTIEVEYSENKLVARWLRATKEQADREYVARAAADAIARRGQDEGPGLSEVLHSLGRGPEDALAHEDFDDEETSDEDDEG
jgi:hypothetical protein